MNDVIITLEGGLKADLDWRKAKEAAQQHISNDRKILWKLHLGLFEELMYAFSHQSQFLSLSLSIAHFITDIWPQFQAHSRGVLLYDGSADYHHSFPWDNAQYENLRRWLKDAFFTCAALEEETSIPFKNFEDATPAMLEATPQGRRLLSLFCRDACVEYINLLAANIKDEIPVFVQLDCRSIDDPALQAQLTAAERYERLLRILPHSIPCGDAKIALCLPPCNRADAKAVEGLNAAIAALHESCTPYKIISEEFLTTEWDELDALVVCPGGLSPQGLRKLQGFCAAGGLVITLGQSPLGLAHEILFEQWN